MPRPRSAHKLGPAVRATGPEEFLDLGDLRVDPVTRTVIAHDRPIELSPREFDLLARKPRIRRRGQALVASSMTSQVWAVTLSTTSSQSWFLARNLVT